VREREREGRVDREEEEREWGRQEQGGVNNIDWKGINTLLLSSQMLEVGVVVSSSEVSSCNNIDLVKNQHV
jgi:hypothetical protein